MVLREESEVKEFLVPDATVVALEASGVAKSAWILEQMRRHAFDLDRPVHYRYHASQHVTRIYQYEYGPHFQADQRDFDMDLSEDAEWDRACELLVQDIATYHAEKGHIRATLDASVD